jgi:ribosomal-protein-alanine N-acetyltransferase
MKIRLTWMIRKHFPEVLGIEQDCFGKYAWSEKELADTLSSRGCIGFVAICEKSDAVVGYMVYESCKDKLKLLNLAVDPAHFRHGIGSQLIAKLVGKLTSNRRTRISTIVRESNLGAQLFLKAVGFRAQVPILKGHYSDTKDDAYKFVYRHGQVAVPNRETAEKLAA